RLLAKVEFIVDVFNVNRLHRKALFLSECDQRREAPGKRSMTYDQQIGTVILVSQTGWLVRGYRSGPFDAISCKRHQSSLSSVGRLNSYCEAIAFAFFDLTFQFFRFTGVRNVDDSD